MFAFHSPALSTLYARIAVRLTVLACGVSVCGIGSTALIGYWLGVAGLWQWHPSAIGMAPNTAVGFVLTGLALSVIGSSNWIWRVPATGG